MHSRLYAKVGTLALIGLTAGCAFHRDHNPHNDVMVFATHTKFGIDVSAPLNSATLPQFNFGYNRAEAVWMPLRPSGGGQADLASNTPLIDVVKKLNECNTALNATISDDKLRQIACLNRVLPTDKYVSMASGVDPTTGGEDIEIDTYSVFASFGARGSISGSEASGGLAQIFATGIAAQRLAANPQVGAALNTAQPAAVIAQAKLDEQKLTSEIDSLRNAQADNFEAFWTRTSTDGALDQTKFNDLLSRIGEQPVGRNKSTIDKIKNTSTRADVLKLFADLTRPWQVNLSND